MKKIFLLSAIVGGLFYNTAEAQVGIHIGVNIPVRRVYVPAQPVYDEVIPVDYSDDYYYLPDVEAYYSVPEQCYYYNNGRTWISAAYLPGYRNYNWRTARRYEVRSPRPYLQHDVYRSRWGGYSGNGGFGRGNYGYNNHSDYGGYRGSDQHYNNRNWAGPGRGQDQRFGNNRQNGNYNGGQNRGNWGGQPSSQNQGYNRGQGRGNWGGGQRSNQSQGGQSRGNWGGQSSNSGGDHDRGNGNMQQHYVQNNQGGRGGNGRPGRY